MSLLMNFEKISTSYKIIEPILNAYLSEAEVIGFSSQLHDRLENKKPRIMVYGVYNAGKSTLLNALMGREEAKVSDRPETSTITPYSWNGYTLLDTPGIDAPEADEKMARNEINRSDVILFVVASGGAIEESKTWEELVDILNRDRKVMLILNNKAGLDPESEDYQRTADKFRKNLQDIAINKKIPSLKLPVICLVDARTALLGKLENERELLEISGMLDLERNLVDFLNDCDSYTVLNTTCRDLIKKIEDAELELQNQGGNEYTKKLTQLQQDIDHEKTKLSNTMNDELDHILFKAKDRMARSIESIAETERNQQSAQSNMREEATNISVWVGEQLSQYLAEALPKTQQALKKIEVSLQESELGTIRKDFNASISGDRARSEKDSVLGQAAKDAIAKMPIADLTQKGTLAALEFGKKTLPELFKGIGKKTMGKWAGVAGKWVGPVIQVGTMLYDLYQANKEAEAERAAKERMHKAIQDAASDFVGELRLVYRIQIKELVKTVFQPLDQWIENMEDSHEEKNESIKKDMALLKRVKLDLQQINQ